MSSEKLTKLEYISLRIFEKMLETMADKIDSEYWYKNGQEDAVHCARSLLEEIAKQEAKSE